ncbi:tRNA (carboxymethyluridine(34)-5-O)-methyltransferase [Silene latifolia]|uniref:tRNA (carboxymethyluridine(34)-5-O)-methyltransferase n=1 Tax=Silene latifolia TaxID=37657 RepID=UPI003D772F63
MILGHIQSCTSRIFYRRISSTMKKIRVGRPTVYSTDSSIGEDVENLSSHLNSKTDCISSNHHHVQFTPEIEKTYVHRVYDAIAPHFSATRFAKWPKVAAFLDSLPRGSLVLDAGCGNGKYLGFNPECFFIGCDISYPLVNICTDRGHEALVADAVNMPYRDGFGDAAISIAVLHHLSTPSRRIKAIEELVRVVRKGGLVLITVWAVEQEDPGLLSKWTPLSHRYLDEWIGPGSPRVRSPRSINLESIPENGEKVAQPSFKDSFDSISTKFETTLKISDQEEDKSMSSEIKSQENQQEYFVPWHLPYHRAEVSGASASAVANGLAKKDDKKGAVVYNRYYHVFSEGELESLVSGMSNTKIVDRFFDKSNWCIILEKTQ